MTREVNPPPTSSPRNDDLTDVPVVESLSPTPDVSAAFRRLCRLPHCLFLDSALRDSQLGRYSFLTADPVEYLEWPTTAADPLEQLRQRMESWAGSQRRDLPPFQGGAAGLFGYDLAGSLERLPTPRRDEFQVPALAVGLYDVVLAFDHERDQCWLISQGLPETEPARRRRRAETRRDEFLAVLRGSADAPVYQGASHPALASSNLARQHPVVGPSGLTSNLSAEEYQAMIEQGVEYIRAGDVFQVNLAQRLLFPARGLGASDSVALYLRLRQRNPAPFAGYFDTGAFQIVSASPERFVQLHDNVVEARPIKGTRGRGQTPEADLFAGDDLRGSEKDRAENVMIVDLLRNDLSRVCDADSVHVSDLCRLEVYQYVQHLVSVVRGRLMAGQGPVDLVRAAFPGGSITGAPKIRAMEVIAELEPTARGAYCGSLGYVGLDGSLDMSILIRTITAGRGWWQFPVGGGIVAQSVPTNEYQETWQKATGMLRALE